MLNVLLSAATPNEKMMIVSGGATNDVRRYIIARLAILRANHGRAVKFSMIFPETRIVIHKIATSGLKNLFQHPTPPIYPKILNRIWTNLRNDPFEKKIAEFRDSAEVSQA